MCLITLKKSLELPRGTLILRFGWVEEGFGRERNAGYRTSPLRRLCPARFQQLWRSAARRYRLDHLRPDDGVSVRRVAPGPARGPASAGRNGIVLFAG